MWECRTEFEPGIGSITSISFSPNQEMIAAASGRGIISIWSTQKAEQIIQIQIHQSPINMIKWLYNGLAILSCDNDGSLILSRVPDLRPIMIYEKIQSPILCIDASQQNDYIATGSFDTALRIYDITSSIPAHLIDAHSQPIASVSFSSTGNFVITASWDGICRMWDTFTGIVIRSFQYESITLGNAIFSPNDQYILASFHDSKLRLFNVLTQKIEKIFEGHKNSQYMIQSGFAPTTSGSMGVFTASEDGCVIGYDISDEQVDWTIPCPANGRPVIAVDNQTESIGICSGPKNGIVKIWKRQ